MSPIIITLPLPPKELSPNARVHWRVKSKATGGYRERAMYAGWDLFPRSSSAPLHNTATVQVQWFTKTAHRPDGDNALASLKALFDGLTDAGIFSDDKWLTHLPIKFAKNAANPRVVLTITPTGETI